jgi:hypothetical protein
MNDFRDLIQKMHDILVQAQDERDQRRDLVESNVPSNRHPEVGWVVYERKVMLDAVNRERKNRQLPGITVEIFVRKVEQLAYGPVDYTDKLALYCAEMSLGRIAVAS